MDSRLRRQVLQILAEPDQSFSEEQLILEEYSLEDILNEPECHRASEDTASDDSEEGGTNLETNDKSSVVTCSQQSPALWEPLSWVQIDNRPLVLSAQEQFNKLLDVSSASSAKYGVPLCLFERDRMLVVGTTSSKVVVLKNQTKIPYCLTAERECGGCVCVTVSPTGTQLAAGFQSGALALWDLVSRNKVKTVQGLLRGPVLSIGCMGSGYKLLAGDACGTVLLVEVTKQFWSYSVSSQVVLEKTSPVFQVHSCLCLGTELVMTVSKEVVVFFKLDPVKLLRQLRRPEKIGYFKIPSVALLERQLAVAWGRSLKLYLIRSLGGSEDEFLEEVAQVTLEHKAMRIFLLKADLVAVFDSCQTFTLLQVAGKELSPLLQVKEKESIRCHQLPSLREEEVINYQTNTVVQAEDSLIYLCGGVKRLRLLGWNQQVEEKVRLREWGQALRLVSDILNRKYIAFSKRTNRLQQLLEQFLAAFIAKSDLVLGEKARAAVQFSLCCRKPQLLKVHCHNQFCTMGQQKVLLECIATFIKAGVVPFQYIPRVEYFVNDTEAIAKIADGMKAFDLQEHSNILEACLSKGLYRCLVKICSKGSDFLLPLNKLIREHMNSELKEVLFGYIRAVIQGRYFSGEEIEPHASVLAFIQVTSWLLDLHIVAQLQAISQPLAYQLLAALLSPAVEHKLQAALPTLQTALNLSPQASIADIKSRIVSLFGRVYPGFSYFLADSLDHLAPDTSTLKQAVSKLTTYQPTFASQSCIVRLLQKLLEQVQSAKQMIQALQGGKQYFALAYLCLKERVPVLAIDTLVRQAQSFGPKEKAELLSLVPLLAGCEAKDLAAPLSDNIVELLAHYPEFTIQAIASSALQQTLRIVQNLPQQKRISVLHKVSLIAELPAEVKYQYLELLAEHKPRRFIHELRRGSYDWQRCLAISKEHGVLEAQCMVAEASGQLSTALELTCKLLVESIEEVLFRTEKKQSSDLGKLRRNFESLRKQALQSDDKCKPVLVEGCRLVVAKHEQSLGRLLSLSRKPTTKLFLRQLSEQLGQLLKVLSARITTEQMGRFIEQCGSAFDQQEIRVCLSNILTGFFRDRAIHGLTLSASREEVVAMIRLKHQTNVLSSSELCQGRFPRVLHLQPVLHTQGGCLRLRTRLPP